MNSNSCKISKYTFNALLKKYTAIHAFPGHDQLLKYKCSTDIWEASI